MIVKNEGSNIKECLEAVKDLVDEMIIVDTGSTDNTVDVAKSFGAIVYNFDWCDDFAKARNFGIGKSDCNWHLFLDADEVIINGSKESLIAFAKNNPNTIGRILIKSSYSENGEISYSNSMVSRFAPAKVLFKGMIHEQLDESYMRKDTEIAVLHSGYLNTNKSERNLKYIDNALKQNPNDNYMLYQKAKTLYSAENYEEAERYFKKAIKQFNVNNPYSSDLIISYIYTLSKTSSIKKGLDIIKRYESIYNNNPDYKFACGEYYLSLALKDVSKYMEYVYKIEDCYISCVNIGVDGIRGRVDGVTTYKAYNNLGALYEVLGLKDNAKNCYKIAAEYGYNPSIERLKALR